MDTELKKVEITREALIEKMIEYRQGNWDASDTWEALYYGRNGFGEFTNADLEQQALDYGIGEEDGDTYVDVAYTITDADTHTVSEEERLRTHNAALVESLKGLRMTYTELLEALKGLVGEIQLGKLNIRKDFSLIKAHACASKAIAKAEGRA